MVVAVALSGACGPGVGAGDTASEGSGGVLSTSNGDTTGGSPTTTDTPTTDTPTTGASNDDTVGDDATGDATGGSFAGSCPAGWEHPASIVALQVDATVPDATIDSTFDPEAVYPDDTSPVCVRWDGDALAGVRVAFGPVAGDGPQSLLEIVVSDGEGEYNQPQWPPPPDAYAGVEATYTVHLPPDAPRIFDYEADEGIGLIIATWVPKGPGEHIRLDAKLSIPADQGAELNVTVDVVVGSDVGPAICESLESDSECKIAGCGGWFPTMTVDPVTCEFTPVGFCAAEKASTGDDEYDSAFFRVIDGVVHIARVGSEGKDSYFSEHPAGWTECTGAPGDPPECACVCVAGECPGDVALALMTACELPTPCPMGEGSWDAHACIFDTVAAGDPAALQVNINFGDPEFDNRVFLRGDGTATWLQGSCDHINFSCGDMDYGVPRTCTLREPAFFADCSASVDPEELAVCHDFEQWFTSCTVEPASCP